MTFPLIFEKLSIMSLEKKYWTWIGILLATVSSVEAQQHHFTNPQVHVQVTRYANIAILIERNIAPTCPPVAR